MAPRSKKPSDTRPKACAKRPPEAPSDTAAGQLAVVVEDMRAQNRAVIEAVLNLDAKFERSRVETGARFDRVESAVLKLSSDVVAMKSDISGLKSDVSGLKSDVSGLKSDVSSLKSSVARIEAALDSKADRTELRAVEGRVESLERLAGPR